MIHRIYVSSKVPDTRSAVKLIHFRNIGFSSISKLEIVDVFTIDKNFTRPKIQLIAKSLANPVSQKTNIDSVTVNSRFSWLIETGFLPGVTDNIATTSKEIIEDLLKVKFSQKEGVYTSQILLLGGKCSSKEISRLAVFFINPLIGHADVKTRIQFLKGKNTDWYVPKVSLEKLLPVSEVNMQISDEELIRLGKAGIPNVDGSRRGPLALGLDYLKAIK
ncbi:MAG: phosphoribosylformylglycinamidine synthase, partial [Patescibacteria group bacterium]